MHKLICLTDKNTISQIITTCGNNAKTVRDYTETSNCSVKSLNIVYVSNVIEMLTYIIV